MSERDYLLAAIERCEGLVGLAFRAVLASQFHPYTLLFAVAESLQYETRLRLGLAYQY